MTTKALLNRNPSTLPSGGARSAAIQSVPLRRAYRDHARRDAGSRPCRRGAGLMAAPDSPDTSRTSARIAVGRSPGRLRRAERLRNLHQDHRRRFGHRLQRPCRSRHRHSHRARADRRRRTRRVLCPRRRRARRYLARFPIRARPSPAKPSRSRRCRLRKAAAQARHFLIARAAERLELAGGRPRHRRRPDPRQGQPQRQLWRIDCRRDHPPRARGRRSGESRQRLHHRRAIGAAHRSAGEGDRRTRFMSTTCACPACCTAAWCGRPMPASMPAPSSAPA